MKVDSIQKERTDFLSEAEDLLQRNDLSGVLAVAAKRLGEFPADPDALAVYCEALIGLGRVDEMRSLLSEVTETISGLNAVYERVGDACRERGFNQDAAACYDKFISLRPDAQRAGEVIGKMALLDPEDHPVLPGEAIPEEEMLTVTLARLYVSQGHLKDAAHILEEIIRKEPDNDEARSMLVELEKSHDLSSSGNAQSANTDRLMETLNVWLKNIERLKIHAAER